MNRGIKTILFWLVALAAVVPLWQVVRRSSEGPKHASGQWDSQGLRESTSILNPGP
jgi:hypothetical protein